MALIYLLISNLLLMIAQTEPHSLQYHFTTDSSPGAGRPSYQAVGRVDDVQIARYDSQTRRVQLLLPWMEEHINPQHWENQTWIAQYYERRQQEIIQDIVKYFNHTKAGGQTFVLQVRFWCLLSGDDSIMGYEEFAANGNIFIALDTFMSKYVPLMSNAEKMAEVWNSRESSAKNQKWYMEQECKRWFKVYLHHMKESLKPVHPEMKLWGRRQSNDVMKLHCLVYGFYPQDVNVKWVRNGVDHVTSNVTSPILPHPDGTYQIRISVEVPMREGDTYSCHVDHSSLEETATRNLTELDLEEIKRGKQSSRDSRIYVVICFIPAVIIGILLKTKILKGRGDNENRGPERIEYSNS